jgi:aminoglycoside phosphotransferase (APT) family kinase protein
VVAWWPDLHVVVGQSVGGTTASSVLGDPSVPVDAKVRLGHDLGELLARFHGLPVVPEATWSADQQVITLADAMAAVECADPMMGIRLGAVLDTLADTMPEPGPPVLAHGSFRAGQVSITPDGRPVLLDVDEVRHSDRERDLGVALAHLTWQGIRKPRQQDALERTERALLSAYQNVAGEVRPDALQWWRTSGLVQVAARRFRRLEVGAWTLTDELATAAENLLADGRPSAVAAPDLLDVGEASVVLGRAAAREVEVEAAELLGVAPGRRSVVRYMVRGLDDERDAVVPVIGKQFTHARSARLAFYHLRLLADDAFGDGPFRVPSPVGLAGEQGLLFYREDVGAPLGSLLDGPAGTEGIRSAAEWLARLHSSDLRLPRELSLAREVESTRQWAIEISQLHPPAAAQAGVLASRWAAAAKSAAVDVVVPIHKDFHAGHVLIGEQTCVIDLDEARMGDPAFDVAHFCTYLAQLGAPASSVEEFLDAYSTATGWADKGSLAPFRAYTCLKIAKQAVVGSGPFRHDDLEHRLAIADAALARGTAWVDTPWEGWS